MGTSRPRTSRRPSPPGPEGARTAYRGTQKTSKSAFGFKRKSSNFVRGLILDYPIRGHVFYLAKADQGRLKSPRALSQTRRGRRWRQYPGCVSIDHAEHTRVRRLNAAIPPLVRPTW